METEFEVISSNPSKGGASHVVKLQSKIVQDLGILGPKEVTRTYYISVKNTIAIGTKVPLDVDAFDVKEYSYTFEDDETGEEKEIMCKWLHLKA